MINRKYSKSKFFISPEILIIIGVILATFCPITIYFYGIPFFAYGIGVFLIWNMKKKLVAKVIWTLLPIILGLIIFKIKYYC